MRVGIFGRWECVKGVREISKYFWKIKDYKYRVCWVYLLGVFLPVRLSQWQHPFPNSYSSVNLRMGSPDRPLNRLILRPVGVRQGGHTTTKYILKIDGWIGSGDKKIFLENDGWIAHCFRKGVHQRGYEKYQKIFDKIRVQIPWHRSFADVSCGCKK